MLPLAGGDLVRWLTGYRIAQGRAGTVRFCLGDMNECIRNAKLCAKAEWLIVARTAGCAFADPPVAALGVLHVECAAAKPSARAFATIKT